MKTIITTILLAVTFFTANAQKNNFKLMGNFPGLKAEKVYMQIYGQKGFVTIASAPVRNGSFMLEGNIEWEDNYYFFSDTSRAKLNESYIGQLFVEKGTTKFSGELGNYPLFKIEGGKYLDKIYSFQSNKKYIELRQQAMSYMDRELSDEEKVEYQKLQQELNPLIGSVDYTWWPSTHPKHQIHLADQYYYDKEFDNFKKQADYVIETYPTHPDANRMRNLKMMIEDEEKNGEKDKLTRIGTPFTEVILKDRNGTQYKLSEAVKKNRLVLLDFWASWCSPCRAEFPHLRLAYKEYKDQGFDIFAVSIDKDNEAWLKALDQEKTEWINVIDLEAWESELVKEYNIRGIPYNVLINSAGQIIGESLRGEALEEVLEKELN